jgi:glycosyltransferase involved in cell wall biosynthesis
VQLEGDLLRQAGHCVESFEVPNPERLLPTVSALARAAWNASSAQRLLDVVDAVQPDVVHVHNTWFSLSPAVLAYLSRRNRPVVMTLHNYRISCANGQLYRMGRPCEDCVGHRIPLSGIAHRCYRHSLPQSIIASGTIALHNVRRTYARSVSRFIVLNNFARSRALAAGLDDRKIVVRPNFVPPAGHREQPASSSSAFLFVGRITEEKGLDLLMDAWPDVPDRFSLRVIGDGPDRAALAARRAPRVTFLGRTAPEVVASEMGRARALLLPSRWYEGQPMVALEAMANGLPIVSTPLGAMGELVGRAGRVVAQNEADQWSTALNALSQQDLENWSAAALSQWREHHSPSTALASLERIYENALRA